MSEFYVITEEQLNRLIEVAVETSNPPIHMVCDWDWVVPKLLIFPLAIYKKMEELRNG